MSPLGRLALILLGIVLAGLLGVIARWRARGYRMSTRYRDDLWRR